MTELLADLAKRFRFNEKLLAMASDGFSEAQWAATPGDQGGNSSQWVLGHLVMCRRHILRRLGEEIPEEPWEKLFAPKTEPADASTYPGAAVLIESFTQLGERLGERLPAVTAEESAADWGSSFPDGSSTISGGVGFMYFHECYHLGQIGLARRIHGMPGFV
ncbi:MAG: DinB family protein [Planctomycetota bacterium]